MVKMAQIMQTNIFDYLEDTYEIEFFDKCDRQRLFWCNALNEQEAISKTENIFKSCQIIRVNVSSRTLDEIEHLS